MTNYRIKFDNLHLHLERKIDLKYIHFSDYSSSLFLQSKGFSFFLVLVLVLSF